MAARVIPCDDPALAWPGGIDEFVSTDSERIGPLAEFRRDQDGEGVWTDCLVAMAAYEHEVRLLSPSGSRSPEAKSDAWPRLAGVILGGMNWAGK